MFVGSFVGTDTGVGADATTNVTTQWIGYTSKYLGAWLWEVSLEPTQVL